jgi:hypothetical protein
LDDFRNNLSPGQKAEFDRISNGTLAAAAAGGHRSVVELLIQQKADVNGVLTKWLDRTALQAAAEGGPST